MGYTTVIGEVRHHQSVQLMSTQLHIGTRPIRSVDSKRVTGLQTGVKEVRRRSVDFASVELIVQYSREM